MHETTLRVRFNEVDLMGVVHHPRYLEYFEIGRTDLIASLGFAYSQMEKSGQRLVISETSVKHFAPARYDDSLRVRTSIRELSRVRIRFQYEVMLEPDRQILATGSTTLAYVDHDGRPRRMPDDLHDALLSARDAS